jgi:hypothetical protein
MSKRVLQSGIVIILAVLSAATLAGLLAGQVKRETARVANSDLGGVVSSPNGAEAGVWVIAETTDLPTKFVKIVVTDDSGRYLVPELPKANYSVWVRGYGLVDSPKVKATPGITLNPASGARANGFARSSTRTDALAVIRWGTRPRARFQRVSSVNPRTREPRGISGLKRARRAAG